MAVNKAICGILKYEKVLGHAISNTLCKIGIQHLCINLFMDNFTCQEAFCHIRLTESQYTPNTNIKNGCVGVCIMQRVFALSLKVLCSDKLYSLKVPAFHQSAS